MQLKSFITLKNMAAFKLLKYSSASTRRIMHLKYLNPRVFPRPDSRHIRRLLVCLILIHRARGLHRSFCFCGGRSLMVLSQAAEKKIYQRNKERVIRTVLLILNIAIQYQIGFRKLTPLCKLITIIT